jgi:hypothetical protein
MARTKREGAAAAKAKKRAAGKKETDGSRGVPTENSQMRAKIQQKIQSDAHEKPKVARGRQAAQRKVCELPRTPQYSPIVVRQLFASPSTEANVSYEAYDFVESP